MDASESLFDERHKFDAVSTMWNMKAIGNIRNLCSLLAGVLAGVFRVEGILQGLVVFLLCAYTGSAMIAVGMARQGGVHRFVEAPGSLWTSGVASGLLSFVLVWTVTYDCIHIF